MIPSELSMMSRSAAAMGPFGSSTPSEQPPKVTAPLRTIARRRGRISSSRCADRAGSPREDDRGRLDAAVGPKQREEHEQIDDRESEQAVSSPRIGRTAPAQPQREPDEDRSAGDGGHAVEGAGKPERPRQQRNRQQQNAVDQDLSCGLGSASYDRQHGDTGTGIFVGTIE